MRQKVILISIDGMRPDGLLQCGSPFVEQLMQRGSYTLAARTVFPSVTLPCHMSMFHSVPPQRHGILTNHYAPMVRPLNGLFEQIKLMGGKSAMFYGWEPLRDIARPGSLQYAEYLNTYDSEGTDALLAQKALERIRQSRPDFVFLYLVETDDKGGHDCGWMTPTYLEYVRRAVECVHAVLDAVGQEYTVIVTADHGGHDRTHGTELPEDMTIPQFFVGPQFAPGRQLTDVSLLDLAPTIADLLGVPPAPEWEGRSLLV